MLYQPEPGCLTICMQTQVTTPIQLHRPVRLAAEEVRGGGIGRQRTVDKIMAYVR